MNGTRTEKRISGIILGSLAARRCGESQTRTHAIEALGVGQLAEWAAAAAQGTDLTWWEYTAGATADHPSDPVLRLLDSLVDRESPPRRPPPDDRGRSRRLLPLGPDRGAAARAGDPAAGGAGAGPAAPGGARRVPSLEIGQGAMKAAAAAVSAAKLSIREPSRLAATLRV
jgi:hypothetical protein